MQEVKEYSEVYPTSIGCTMHVDRRRFWVDSVVREEESCRRVNSVYVRPSRTSKSGRSFDRSKSGGKCGGRLGIIQGGMREL